MQGEAKKSGARKSQLVVTDVTDHKVLYSFMIMGVNSKKNKKQEGIQR